MPWVPEINLIESLWQKTQHDMYTSCIGWFYNWLAGVKSLRKLSRFSKSPSNSDFWWLQVILCDDAWRCLLCTCSCIVTAKVGILIFYRATVNHGRWYIFWKLWPTTFRLWFPKSIFCSIFLQSVHQLYTSSNLCELIKSKTGLGRKRS